MSIIQKEQDQKQGISFNMNGGKCIEISEEVVVVEEEQEEEQDEEEEQQKEEEEEESENNYQIQKNIRNQSANSNDAKEGEDFEENQISQMINQSPIIYLSQNQNYSKELLEKARQKDEIEKVSLEQKGKKKINLIQIEKQIKKHKKEKSADLTQTNLEETNFNLQESQTIFIQNEKLKAQSLIEKFQKILIVDDTYFNIQALQEFLQDISPNLIIETAFNGQEAVDQVDKDSEIDLVFMDINMPIMDGVQASRIIQASKKEFVRIISVTAFDGNQNEQMFKEAGIEAIIPQPVNIYSFINALQKL